MMKDYISLVDAAAQIGMSPARFADLVREKRDVLPVEMDWDMGRKLCQRGHLHIVGHPLDDFYIRARSGEIIYYLKIHRLDWEAYLAGIATGAPSAEPASTSPVAGQEGAFTKWPWGDHETELLRNLDQAAEKFWKSYDPAKPATAPTNEQVSTWLVEQGVSARNAQAIATILRADDVPKGPRPAPGLK